VYVSHHQISSRLLGLRPGQHATIAGVPVARSPEVAGRSSFRGGKYRVNQGPEQLLLASIDALAREAGLRPVAGGPPWREDDEPAPSYGRGPASGCDNDRPCG
jgi:hypothetical protein